MSRAYVGIGSNVGDRRAHIAAAVASLRAAAGVEVVTVSDPVETAPVGGPPGQGPYLNAAVEVETTLDPRRLLETLLEIETARGRDRGREGRWGPRPLDLDLLLYEQRVIEEPGLVVPHPRLHERTFVLGPLARIAPRAWHPVMGRTIECLHAEAAARAPAE